MFEAEDLEDDEGFIECPFIPLRDLVFYPQMVMPLFVGRDRSLAAVQAAVANGETIILSAQRDSNQTDPGANDLYDIATEAAIGRMLRMPDNSATVLVQGRRRVQIVEFLQWNPYIRVRARVIHEPDGWQADTEARMRTVLDLFERVVELSRRIPDDAFTFALNIEEPGWLADFIAATLELNLLQRQELLETFEPIERLQKISVFLAQEADVLELEDQIHSQVQQSVERSQREHFLREQMRVIQGELGEGDIFSQELEEVKQAFANKVLPDVVKAKVDKEIARLAAMPPMAPEVGIVRTYLDWILELPWTEKQEENLDVPHAAAILNEDHYGLEKIKDRILEFIAVKKIAANKMRTPILCFVGPPGTGKTSLGRSIARALGREFVRVSLGGVRDEAEIRGHRRTYIGALPGRILQTMRRVKSVNPLFMLDEVDKLGQDFRGDPSSALLEVLDPEQNKEFLDHYLDLDYDLSNVLFVTTANSLDPIPRPLLDRMEVIEFSSYMEEEKLEIARTHLIPKQLEEHGLADTNVRFDEDALKAMIRQYTYEAGVRNLNREIANVCRKIARRVAEGRRHPHRIYARLLPELLGPPHFSEEVLRENDEIGVATGVAWTSAGGDTMLIEVNLMPGKGNLTLTGQLGEVMQESAQAALTYTRSQSGNLGIDDQWFEKMDIHIHIPEGAVPKDGPSAGVALTTALVSAFTNRPVRRDVGMTGEVTLRGRVLPVGGIREKALAARRLGITTFIMPQKNKSDLEEIPRKLRQDLRFILVERMDHILQEALLPPVTPPKPARRRKKASEPAEEAESSEP
ncbi:MAG: endopeptidase La [Chloroflexi bacterium]|nr:endopeptidase La [Chloroflexota bacterium]MBP8057904.1 endopeptidase La [Chloroflexota bacterium]